MHNATTAAARARQTMMPFDHDGSSPAEITPELALRACHDATSWNPAAAAVPTSTGTIAAGRVRGLAPATQMRQPVGVGGADAVTASRSLGELVEVRAPLLDVGVAPL